VSGVCHPTATGRELLAVIPEMNPLTDEITAEWTDSAHCVNIT
jgi:hypothetical protein